MLVKYWMKEQVVTVDVDDPMHKAISLLRKHQQPLLPVLKKGQLVGVITDRDLKRASASDATALEIHELAHLISKIKCSEIMTKKVVTVPPEFTLEEAAAQLVLKNISSMPVVDDQGKIVGTISQQEIFLSLISLTGFGEKGLQLAFEVEDRPGSIKEVTDIIRRYEGRLVSLLTSFERAHPGKRRLYVRAWSVDRKKMLDMLRDLKEKASLLYLVDHSEGKREEYVQSGWAD